MKKILLSITILLITLVSCTISHVHQYHEEIFEATCTSEGYTLHYCQCGDQYRDNYKKALEHQVEIIPYLAPTLTTTGLTEGKKCSICGEILLEQEVIPCLKNNTSYILFGNLKNADYQTLLEYDNTKVFMLDSLAEPFLEDYTFLGWYTQSNGGEKIDYIKPNDQNEFPIFAHWEIKKYHINYINAPGNDFPTEYDVESEIILGSPSWQGLQFSHWTDSNGNVVQKIEKGTKGDLTLEANWIDRENYATNTDENQRFESSFYEDGNYYLIYNLGTISNVRLKTIEAYTKMEGIPINYEISESYQCDKSVSEAVSETTKNVVTSSHSYTNAKSFMNSLSFSISGNRKENTSIGIPLKVGSFTAAIERSLGFSINNNTEWKNSNSTTDSETSQTENSKTISSTVTYNSTVTKEINRKETISADMPAGIYSYVCSGTAYVFGIVTFEGKSGNWYINIVSVLGEEVSEGFFYKPSIATNVKIESKATLEFNIPLEDIKNDYFYVKYETNPYLTTLPTSVVKVGESITLPYIGDEAPYNLYNFIEWQNENGSVYQNGETINLNGTSTEIIKLTGKLEEINVKAKLFNKVVPFNQKYERFASCNIDLEPLEVYKGNNLDISFDYINNIYYLNLKGYDDPSAIIGQTVNLEKGKTYYVYGEINNDLRGHIQMFYGINNQYSEPQSIILMKNNNLVSFMVQETGTYNIRFDNDYGVNVELKNFTIYEGYDEYIGTLSEVNTFTNLGLPTMKNYISTGYYSLNGECYYNYNGNPSDNIIELIKKDSENVILLTRFIQLNGNSSFEHKDCRINYDAGNYQKYITGLNIDELIKMGYNKIRIIYTIKMKKISSDPDGRDAYVWFNTKIGVKKGTYNPNPHAINPYSDTELVNINGNSIKLENSNLKKNYYETTIDECFELELIKNTNGSFYLRFGSEYDAYIGDSSISFQVFKDE